MDDLEILKENPLDSILPPIKDVGFYPIHGRVLEIVGSIIKVLVKGVQLGELCTIHKALQNTCFMSCMI